MNIAIDFDGTVVEEGPYDATTPLRLKAGARYGLHSLKRAGHKLMLWSGRASPALIEDPSLDPWVRSGVKKLNLDEWRRMRVIHFARYKAMLAFITAELPGIFDAVDDGHGGKPSADLFIDDKVLRLGYGTAAVEWLEVAQMYGEPAYEEADGSVAAQAG
jgi:hypothetical protein